MRYLMLLASVLVVLLLFVGCSEDDPVVPDVRRGTISIAPEPDGISPRWTLTGPDKYLTTGTGAVRLENLEPGEYTIVWGVAPGWEAPDRSPVTQTLERGETLVFSRVYTALPPEHSITISTDPENIDAPWQLSGPNGFNRSGNGHLVLRDMAIGSYTLAWGDLAGYNTPDPAALTLSLPANGALIFLGSFTPKAGTITINALPGSIDSCWRLAGPEGIQEGTGNTVLTDMEPGDYTLVWCSVPGWNVPEPATVAQALLAGESLTFTGLYTARAGTITINPLPASLDAPWRLSGPAGFNVVDYGQVTLPDMSAGSYTITWDDVTNWEVPPSDTQELDLNGTLIFTGIYTTQFGTIVIEPEPITSNVSWMLTGPHGFCLSGEGSIVAPQMMQGQYTLTWLDMECWTAPSPATVNQTLQAAQTLVFSGNYTAHPGEITIHPEPDAIDAPWILTGPGFRLHGSGTRILSDMVSGSYSIIWGVVLDWVTPPTATQSLDPCGEITFCGVYTKKFAYIPPGEFLMGSAENPEWQAEPGRYNNERQHRVVLTRGFYMSKYEVTEELWDEIMGSGILTSQLPKGGVSWDMAVEFCNALSLREGLAPAYTIHSSNGQVTWDRNANGYRLPTEAEWEYASRADSQTAFANGPIEHIECSPVDPSLALIGWYCGNIQDHCCPAAVGQKQPNAWGLFDMHGNVREWVWDAYESHFPIQSRDPVRDGAPGVSRVIRGGHWNSEARQCRSAFREPLPPSDDQLYNGLRPVRTVF